MARRSAGPAAAVREAVLERDDYSCQYCGLFPSYGYSIHHRQGRRIRDPHRPANLVMFCGSGTTGCHSWVHAHPAESYARGWMVRRNGIGTPEETPMLTPDGWVLLNDDGTVTHTEPPTEEGTA